MTATKRGFTLVELLIVITVFVITFALLTPFVNKMRERADVIKCSANVRLLSLALHMYAADHDDAFPPDLGSLYPGYVKEESVFDCPASKFIGTAAKSDYEYIPGLSESSMPGGGKTLTVLAWRPKSAWIWVSARRTVAVAASTFGRTTPSGVVTEHSESTAVS